MANSERTATRLDHLVLIAASLEQGAAYCQRALGVTPAAGGRHDAMGTHNLVLNLGRQTYLEVIAIDPLAAPLARARWFGMDSPEQRQRLQQSPYLATFVAATDDVSALVDRLPQLGQLATMQRGNLTWQITLTQTGAMNQHGAVPSVIQWPAGVHPTSSMAAPEFGGLRRLQVFHPQPAAVRTTWREMGLAQEERLTLELGDPSQDTRLVAWLDTPRGLRSLS